MNIWIKIKEWFTVSKPTLVEQVQEIVEQEKNEEVKTKRKPRKKKTNI